MISPFRIALTADFFDSAGTLRYLDIGADLCADQQRFQVDRFAEHRQEIAPQQLAGYHGAVVLSARVTARSLTAAENLLAIGRFGVGYDSVDVAACTAADVLLFITVGAVDYSVAEATVGWMLALAHHVRTKDRLVREARWDERSGYMGCELRGRTLGLVGFGGIGRAVVKLLAGFGMNPHLVFDPYAPADAIVAAGARSVSLEELLRESDFVSLHCPLNDSTRGLIGVDQLRLMKPSAYLINTARGGIVEEDPLYHALRSRQIAGAAIDCFATEPLTSAPQLAELENVLLAPHCIAWTNELFRDIGRAAFQGMIDLAEGRPPRGMVNPEVLNRPAFQYKWRRLLACA